MRIDGSRKGALGGDGRRPVAVATPSRSASRALTVIAGPAAREPTPQTRGDSAYLAQLIATKAQAPQTRARRRAEPAEALAAYRAVANLKF
jgi:hypothetical protein